LTRAGSLVYLTIPQPLSFQLVIGQQPLGSGESRICLEFSSWLK